MNGCINPLLVDIRLSTRPLTGSYGCNVRGLGVGQESVEEMSIRLGLEEGLCPSPRHLIGSTVSAGSRTRSW
jgi:hypothetical protein